MAPDRARGPGLFFPDLVPVIPSLPPSHLLEWYQPKSVGPRLFGRRIGGRPGWLFIRLVKK